MMPSPPEASTRPSGRTQRLRKRAPAACQSCHARKVRCSLPQTGIPCSNCSLDDVSCVPRVSRRQNKPVLRSSIRHPSPASSLPLNGHPAAQSTLLEDHGTPLDPDHLAASEDPSLQSGHITTAPLVENAGDGTETSYHPFNEHFSHHDGEGDTVTSQQDGDVADKGYSPLYGDPRGIGLVVDICEPEPREKSGHFLIPRIDPTHIDQETINYLRHKGVFDFPAPAVCDMIIRTYFHYVHPFFPVVDACSFLDMFEKARNKLSIHLLWSMFLAAANFADDITLKAANFPSRKDMKRAMYNRAKALYDAEYERRKVTLIQAVLLMGFWYSDTEDRTGPWHWNGIAIGLCQTIGLHRQPDIGQKHGRAIPPSDRRIWQRLWWSCFYREVWFSAGMGRPMRINPADCSTPMPDANNSDDFLAEVPETVQKKYLPEGIENLSNMWRKLLALTVSLAKILSWQNRVQQTRPSKAEIQCMDDDIRQSYPPRYHITAHGKCHVVSLHAHHLELYVESVILTLYRPIVFEKMETNVPDVSADEWKSTVVWRTKDAATSTNRILSNMISADMISTIQAMICIALVPALQIHLLESISEKRLVQCMGRHNLELCMMVIEELKPVYFGAEILSRMFTKAKRRIYDRTRVPSMAPTQNLSETSRICTNALVPSVKGDARPTDVEIFDAFSEILNPFVPAAGVEFFDNDELLDFEPDIMFGQPMFPESESSAATR